MSDNLRFLLERQSIAALAAPAPAGEALQQIIQAGLRAPDHGRLRPWQFIVAEGEGLDRLGGLIQKAAIASGKPDNIIQRAAEMPRRAPMVIIVVATFKPHDSIPMFEQQLSAGCAVMTMQMASRALGFGGIWRSGWPMFDRGLHADLGLGEQDQIVGFLYLGTPQREAPAPAPTEDTERFVRWL